MTEITPTAPTQTIARTRIITLWLGFCAFMILAMTGIGAITRLTESGLSITEWNVVSGILPPLSHDSWQSAFDKYQKTPEFIQKHHWMTLDDFKQIFFWEWFHRLWGRLIGIVFGIPLVFFMAKGWIEKKDRLKFIALFALGGAQGGLGWFMVKSGLVNEPAVSHFRLAAHLSLALTIYMAIIIMMTYLNRNKLNRNTPAQKPILMGMISLFLLGTTIVWGAFTAGLDAGMIYNTFPLMGTGLIPPELGAAPFFHDPASIQFTHRVLAILTGCGVFVYAFMLKRYQKYLAGLLVMLVIGQIALGIITLLTLVWIPVAVIHQLNAAILLGALTFSISALTFGKEQ